MARMGAVLLIPKNHGSLIVSSLFEKNSFLFGGNAIFIDEIYQRYLKDPSSVDSSWQSFFKSHEDSISSSYPAWGVHPKVVGAEDSSAVQTRNAKKTEQQSSHSNTDLLSIKAKLISMAYREYGHRLSTIDPLGVDVAASPEEIGLGLKDFGIADSDLDIKIDTNLGNITVREYMSSLRAMYSGGMGLECSHVYDSAEREWLYEKFETPITSSKEEQKFLIESLVAIEGMETYIHTKFPGAKRFSVEGGEASIAALEYSVEHFSSHGAKEIVIGMAHRGRLATLTRVVGKPYRAILAEFSGKSAFDKSLGIAGDVKYHMGYHSRKQCQSGATIDISLLPNPSHLEAVNPVLAGCVRAKQDVIEDSQRRQVVGILIHGDAAFAGQGVVAESIAMSGLEPYTTGGIMHFVINNQVGFTANPKDARVGRYSTDMAKISGLPIFHANGDDPDSVLFVTKIAVEYTQKFGKDAVVEVVCYRKYGHNEGDEPMYTQPKMYEIIKQKKSPAALYGEKLEKIGVLSTGAYSEMVQKFKANMDLEFGAAADYSPLPHKFEGLWAGFVRFDDKAVKTGVAKKDLVDLGGVLCTFPSEFNINPKLRKLFEQRKEDLSNDTPIDWATGEQLAFATLLRDGVNIRITGQDAGRGTFSHRHSVLHDQETGGKYLPLNNIGAKGSYEVHDSNLSEYGVLGFEFGYSTVNPKHMTIWEAQFGDFANGAQIIFDQFISSAETKWMQMSGLVMLLPHGYEGQGPEHSSARLERYLQLCAENNIQVTNPTTPASLFHLLRRQMFSKTRKPLVIMSPKSLLRHKLAVSNLDDLSIGSFQKVI
ncbi:MAG: 2-oxoglutarate dehydrogenase e1 component, partial [Pseudomonadota bacterium]